MMTINVPIKVDIAARATSTFTRENVEDRLVVLKGRPQDEPAVTTEIEFLLNLKVKMGWTEP